MSYQMSRLAWQLIDVITDRCFCDTLSLTLIYAEQFLSDKTDECFKHLYDDPPRCVAFVVLLIW